MEFPFSLIKCKNSFVFYSIGVQFLSFIYILLQRRTLIVNKNIHHLFKNVHNTISLLILDTKQAQYNIRCITYQPGRALDLFTKQKFKVIDINFIVNHLCILLIINLIINMHTFLPVGILVYLRTRKSSSSFFF